MKHTRFRSKRRGLRMDAEVMMRISLWAAICMVTFLCVTVVLPALLQPNKPSQHGKRASLSGYESLASPQHNSSAKEDAIPASASVGQTVIPVYLTQSQEIDRVPLEQYVAGVVAAEMPIEFELEALKAQAMAARTYIIRRMMEQDYSKVPVKEAWVTDSTAHQAYLTDEALHKKWTGELYDTNMAKINRAVRETRDLILTYEGKAINATFFSTSNGYTENADEVWPFSSPYLRSVPCPWDVKLSSKYMNSVTLPYKEVLKRLGVSSISTVSTGGRGFQVLENTAGHRIKKIRIGGKVFTGVEVREKLGLNSSQFDWKWEGTKLVFTSYGYGHGVGMSQWGANGMAKEGQSAEQIVKYFYRGIAISQAPNL